MVDLVLNLVLDGWRKNCGAPSCQFRRILFTRKLKDYEDALVGSCIEVLNSLALNRLVGHTSGATSMRISAEIEAISVPLATLFQASAQTTGRILLWVSWGRHHGAPAQTQLRSAFNWHNALMVLTMRK